MGRPIVHFEIMGNDAVRLQRFYAELFDWKIGEPAAMLADPDGNLMGLVKG